jgi:transposase-like protein
MIGGFNMAGKKGMRHYPASVKAEVVKKLEDGESIKQLSREYGISRYAIFSWSGRKKPKEPPIPKHRGRPRKTPISKQRELELENKQLRMEVDLLRSFLQVAGRR